jgi:hypothetical protein
MPASPLSWLLDVPEHERQARLRELRLTARFLLGPRHPATQALSAAISDPELAGEALRAVDALPALQRRRVLAVVAAVL